MPPYFSCYRQFPRFALGRPTNLMRSAFPAIILHMMQIYAWRKMRTLLCAGALLLGVLCATSAGHAQTVAARGEIDLDLRARIAAIGHSGTKLHATTLRLGIELAPGVRVRAYGAHRYGFFAAQEAVVEKSWGGNAGQAQAGLVRLPFGIYDPRETYASGLIDYPMPRGDYYHSVDWGAPGVAWSGGPPRLQLEAAGFSGRGTGMWDNQAQVHGGAARAQTYYGDAILGVSRWDGALQDIPTSPMSRPVHMTGVDLRYTKTQFLMRGEYLFGTLAGDHMHGWYLDAYYRLPQHEHWSLVARIEALKPGDEYLESRQITLGARYVLSPEWTLAANWRRNNGPFYAPTWTPAAPKNGDVLLQAYRRMNW